jgi:hypothetical protein
MRELGVPHLGQGTTDEIAERDTINRSWFCSTASILSVEGKGKKGEEPITTSPNHRKDFFHYSTRCAVMHSKQAHLMCPRTHVTFPEDFLKPPEKWHR